MKYLIYVTKSKPWLFFNKSINYYSLSNKKVDNDLNGKIVAEFDGEVNTITMFFIPLLNSVEYLTGKEPYRYFSYGNLLKASCLNDNEMYKYLGCKDGWAIHINDLKIFEEPKKLSDYHISYYNKDLKMMREKHLEKAPQNMCRAFDVNGNYIVLSVHPEWACKILNGEKTIEVRKQVLNCMKGD